MQKYYRIKVETMDGRHCSLHFFPKPFLLVFICLSECGGRSTGLFGK